MSERVRWFPLLILAALFSACAGTQRLPAPAPVLPFATDSARAETVRPGVTHRYLHSPVGPWAIHVLEVDLDRCYSAVAVKGAGGAIGREKTSILLRNLRRTEDVVGGVNADFFLFTPPGVPTGALISRGRVVAGPSGEPVLGFDSVGIPHITTLRVTGQAILGGWVHPIIGWNRFVPAGLAVLDARWGRVTDTATRIVEVVLAGWNPSRVVLVDTTRAGVSIPDDGAVLVGGGSASATLRAALLALRPGDTVRVAVSLAPGHPLEAVGGRPLLLRDSAVVGAVDTEGQPGFATGRHPRTAVGIARGGRRLILVAVDGRQMPYSDGMTLRELATLMLALGAPDALNLDGGGSTTLVYAAPDSLGVLRIANRPSDREGERPVGDALAIVHRCGR